MTFGQFRIFKNILKSRKFEEDHEIEEAGIGSYEFQGHREFDKPRSFIQGSVFFRLPFLLSFEDESMLLKRYEDDLKEKMSSVDLASGKDILWGALGFSRYPNQVKSECYLCYESNV